MIATLPEHGRQCYVKHTGTPTEWEDAENLQPTENRCTVDQQSWDHETNISVDIKKFNVAKTISSNLDKASLIPDL